MIKEAVNYVIKQLSKLGKYKFTLSTQRLVLLVLVVTLSACCAGLYGVSKYQEGLVNKEDASAIPPDALELGTGKPVSQSQQYLPGVSKNEIPEGDEDLYILKSQIVPPVCPKCPTVINKCGDVKEKCPPCPACARCPEPSFECKKVPNYSSSNTNTLPMPLLNDFSQF